jgi:hypothetical protein
MTYENIQFNKAHFTNAGEYFYLFDDTHDSLFVKLQDGTIAFSYPLLTPLVRAITSCEYDGFYFWTLETPSTYDVTIKKWRVTEDNYCELIKQLDFVDDAANRYVSTAFTLEHYRTTFNTTVSGGAGYVDLVKYADKVDAGNIITLGPNTNGEYEEVTVTGTISGTLVGLTFFTEYTYEVGDSICFNKNLWLFSDWQGVVNDGALYKINPDNGEIIDRFDDNEYKNVTCCTFAYVTKARHVGNIDALFYIKSNTLKFLNTDDLSYYTTMLIDNIRANGTTVIPVYDLVIKNNTAYRLQLRARYPHTDTGADTDYVFTDPAGDLGPYNYVLSPIRNVIDSFVLDAYPAILPANGVNIAQVRAAVKDQYGLDLAFKPVSFGDDDSYGFMKNILSYTWADGVARNYYNSGIQPRTVTLSATMSQYD